MDTDLEAFLSGLPLPKAPSPRRRDGGSELKAAIDFLTRLEDRRRSRLALADDRLDGQRFRYWFTVCTGNEISLDEWRKLIDLKILESRR